MKIIFLDIDGVLNNEQTTSITKSGYTFVDDALVQNLQRLIQRTNAKVVLSSDWRFGSPKHQRENYISDYNELNNKLMQFGIEIFDSTPIIQNGWDRGIEIQTWLDEHKNNVESIVILDDRDDMYPNEDYLVWCNPEHGFTSFKLNLAYDMLTKNMWENKKDDNS